MEEEIKAVRTIKEFVAWYKAKENLTIEQSLQGDLELRKFYIKFKYILEQDEQENINMGKLLG